MKLTINFTTLADMLRFVQLQPPEAQALMNGTTNNLSAIAAQQAQLPATVTAEKQEAARQSTGKAETGTNPALTPFEKSGLADLIMDALKVNADATKGVLISHGGVLKGKPNGAALKPETYEKVRAELEAIVKPEDLAAAGEPAVLREAIQAAETPPVQTYAESGLKEKIAAMQGDPEKKAKILAMIKELAVPNEDGKYKGSNIPPEKFAEAHKRLDELAQA